MLIDLLQGCTLRITAQSEAKYGTGFFVAPRIVLTCAHVIGYDKTQSIKISWQGNALPGEVLQIYSAGQPGSSASDWPDLALIKVNLDTHPCVLIDPEIRVGDNLYSFGFSDEYPNGDSATIEYEGTSTEPLLMKFKEGQIRPGFSGSPLLNLRTGAVCGIIKMTRHREADLGGRGITLGTLIELYPDLVRSQAAFHENDPVWIKELSSIQQTRLLHIPRSEKYSLAEVGYPSTDVFGISLGIYWHLAKFNSSLRPYGHWNLASPVGGLVRTMAADWSDNRVLYAGIDKPHGVFKSIDGGFSWDSASIGLKSTDLNYLTVSPHDGAVFAATDQGLWISRNNCATWEASLAGIDILTILLSPDDPALRVLGSRRQGGTTVSSSTAATFRDSEDLSKPRIFEPHPGLADGNLHFSRDKGESWTTYSVENVNDMLLSPFDSSIFYVASIEDGFFFKRKDQEILEELSALRKKGPTSIAIPKDIEGIIAVGCSHGLVMTYDSGENWIDIQEIGDRQVADVHFVGGDHNYILAASSDGLFVSHDGGKSWRREDTGLSNKWLMTILETPSGDIFVGTSGGGIYQRRSGQTSWTARNLGISTMPSVALAFVADHMFSTAFSIYRSTDRGRSWIPTVLWRERVWEIQAVIRKGMQTSKPKANHPGILLSTDDGNTWRSPENFRGGLLLVGTEKSIYLGRDGGTIWNLLHKFEQGEGVRKILVSGKLDSQVFVWVGRRGIFSSDDFGTTWSQIAQDNFFGGMITAAELMRGDEEQLIVANSAGELYKSSDSGTNWTKFETRFSQEITAIVSEPNAIRVATLAGEVYQCDEHNETFVLLGSVAQTTTSFKWITLAVTPTYPRLFLLGTSNGAYKSFDAGKTWTRIPGGLLEPAYHVNAIVFHNGIAYAAMREGVFSLTAESLLEN